MNLSPYFTPLGEDRLSTKSIVSPVLDITKANSRAELQAWALSLLLPFAHS